MMAVTSLIRERGMRFWRTTGSKTNGSSRVIPTRKRQQEGKQARGHGASSGRRADRHLLHQRGVFTVSGKTSPRYWNRLYRNLGGFRFQDVTESAGVAGAGYSMGAAAADYDNDGLLDLFVVNYVQWSPESDTARRAGGLMNWAASKAVAQVHRLSPCSMLGGKPREELSDLLQVCVVHGATAYRRPTTPAGTFALLNEIRRGCKQRGPSNGQTSSS